jgi:hypothetical protein
MRVLGRAPPGEQVLLRRGTVLRGEIQLSTPLHLRAEDGVTLSGTLHLLGGAPVRQSIYLLERPAAVAVAGGASKDAAAEAVGMVEGLSLSHFNESAVLVRGGSWQLAGWR